MDKTTLAEEPTDAELVRTWLSAAGDESSDDIKQDFGDLDATLPPVDAKFTKVLERCHVAHCFDKW